MLSEDPAAFWNNCVEKLRQALPAHGVCRGVGSLLSKTKFGRPTIKGEDARIRGELTLAAHQYRSVNGIKSRAGKRLARRTLQLRTQMRTEISSDAGDQSTYLRSGVSDAGPIKVLWFLNNSLPYTRSGYTFRTHKSLKELNEIGVKPTGVTRLGYPCTIGSLAKKPVLSLDSVFYWRMIPYIYPANLVERQKTEIDMLEEVARSVQPKVLHTTTDFKNAQVVSQVAKALGIPWVYEVRGELENTWLSKLPESSRREATKSEYYTLARKRETEAMMAADAVVALSEVSKKNIEKRGVDGKKIYVVPNAISHEEFPKSYDQNKVRKQLGLSSEAKWFGTVTSVVEYEGLEIALRALPVLNSEWNLLIVGDGTDLPNLRNLAKELKVEDRVVFAGRQNNEDIWRWYAALDVFIVPRIDSEVCRNVTPLKPLMAKALGVPTVCTDLPALREVSAEGGLFFSAGDLNDFVDQVTRAVRDKNLGKQGRAWAANRTWSANAHEYDKIYRALVGKNT